MTLDDITDAAAAPAVDSRPLTPDFIDHAWRPLASASRHDDGFVDITWPDGAT